MTEKPDREGLPVNINGYYGEAPVDLGEFHPTPGWEEFMHYLYLPVRIPFEDGPSRTVQQGIPPALAFLASAVEQAMYDAATTTDHLDDPYVYVTARRGFATPGNPLNRPGWHCDDFGGTDLNYIWSDRYPTRFLRSNIGNLAIDPDDDERSMKDMAAEAHSAWVEMQMQRAADERRAVIEDGPVGHLLRLSPYVIHDTPIIPAPGGMRSFFKISVSTHRYNLLGNSHNHLLAYDWKMYDRAEVRNQPGGNGDYVREEART